jgi:hypothetical protein
MDLAGMIDGTGRRIEMDGAIVCNLNRPGDEEVTALNLAGIAEGDSLKIDGKELRVCEYSISGDEITIGLVGLGELLELRSFDGEEMRLYELKKGGNYERMPFKTINR